MLASLRTKINIFFWTFDCFPGKIENQASDLLTEMEQIKERTNQRGEHEKLRSKRGKYEVFSREF